VKHIVQFSNGAASAWVAWWVLQNYNKENVILLNHDPGAEHPDSKRFQKEVSDFLNHPVVEVSHDKGLWELIKEQNALPSSFIPYCTRILKQEQGEKFLKTIEGKFILYNGFGLEEWRRVQKATARAEHMGRKVFSPLYENRMTGENAKQIIKNKWKICLPEPYKYLSHNNCIPCFKAGQGHFVKVAKHFPEEYQKAMEMEEYTGHTVFKKISLKELKRRYVDGRQTLDFPEDETVPCMCAE